MTLEQLQKLARLVRYWILKMTTEAGSGHVTSSFSATELMVGLMFGGSFRFKIPPFAEASKDRQDSGFKNNDRLIFSKGHASPLFYALWAAAENTPLLDSVEGPSQEGNLPEALMSLRKFGSRLEGHPTRKFQFTEAATGSLGQGLSVGLGMALNAKLDQLSYKTYVLLGDSEMAEGQVWEAIQLAAHYQLDNLIGILDVNRLGQRGETMYGHEVGAYERRLKAFGWETLVVDGHDMKEVLNGFVRALEIKNKPVMMIAYTIKGKGVSFLEDKEGWHGKALSAEQLEAALKELGPVDTSIRGRITEPEEIIIQNSKIKDQNDNPKNEDIEILKQVQDDVAFRNYQTGEQIATRKAYGEALAALGRIMPEIVVLDGEVSNSTYAEEFKKVYPERFFEMYIAEQNMVSTAVGLARRGKVPFVSTFAAFLTRAADQLRMAAYSQVNLTVCGSHAGVSVGEDGVSQMGLEDLALFRTIFDSVVLYPADAVSTAKLVQAAAQHPRIVYLRTTRGATPVIYSTEEEFPIGGCKVLRQSSEDKATVVAVGITVHEALKAYEELLKEGVKIRVIDLYSVKPLDAETLKKAAEETGVIITVEDHYPEGGIGEAVTSSVSHPGGSVATDRISTMGDSIVSSADSLQNDGTFKLISLAVRKMPMSGKPEELLRYEEIDAEAIVGAAKSLLSA